MRAATIRLVFFKEFVEALRDYRTMVPMVFMSLAMGPLLTLAAPKFGLAQVKAIVKDKYAVAMVGDSKLIGDALAKSPLMLRKEIGTMPAREAVDKGLIDAAVVAPEGFDQAAETDFSRAQKVDIVYNGTRAKSSLARYSLSNVIKDLSRTLLHQRMEKLGIELKPPPYIDSKSVSPESPFGVTSAFLQMSLSCFLMMMALLGVIYPALDAVTGERERHTLEPLLMTQAERSELFAGKLLTVASTSYISVVLTMLGFFLSQFFQDRVMQLKVFIGDAFPFYASFPWPCFVVTTLMMLPLCITLAAAALMFASHARTVQQGQGYFFPLMIVSLLPLPVVLLGNIHLNAPISATPFLNAVVAFNDILCGYVDFTWLAVTGLVSLVFCFLVVLLASPLLAREDLLFGVEDSPARRFAANDYRRELFFLFVVVFLLMFYGSQVLVVKFNLLGVALTQILIVLLPALVFVHYWLRLPLSTVINLSLPKGGILTLLSAVMMAPMTVTLASLFVLLQSKFMAGTETMNKLMAKALGIGDQPILMLVLVIGVLPGICEELLFRGVALSLLPRRFSQAKLIAVVGTLFGAFHLSLVRFMPTAALGALLTFLRLRTGSLWPAMLLHCMHNSLSVLTAKYITGEPPLWMFGAGVLSGVVGLFLLLRATRD